MHDGQYNEVEMTIESAASLPSKNDKQGNSDESQTSETRQPLTLNIPVASAKKNQRNAENKGSQGKVQMPNSNKGNAKPGKQLDFVEANYLKINIDNIVERAFKYEVKIGGNVPKKLHTKIFLQFCAEFLPIKQNKQIAFDDRDMIALSPCQLDIGNSIYHKKIDFVLPVTENDWKKSKKSQSIRLNKTWSCMVSMRPAGKKFIPIKQGLSSKNPHYRREAIQSMNIILNSAFHQSHLNHGIQDGRSLYLKLNDDLPDIKGHYVLRSGLHQRILLGEEEDGSIRPLLNVDVKHRAFPREYNNLIDLLHDISKEDTTPRCVINLKEKLNANALKKLSAHLAGLEICYKFDEMNNGILKFVDFGNKPAFEIMSKQNGTPKMVEKYFDERNLRIKYSNLQCIRLADGWRHISVPIEYCSIIGDQLVEKKFNAKQFEEIKRYTVIDPSDRKEMIMHHLRSICHNQCDTVRAFGLRVDENFMRVPARQIQPPIMEYADRKMTKPKNGEWSMIYGCDNMEVLSTSPTTFSWTILNTDRNLLDVKLKQFAKALYRKSLSHRILLNDQPNEIVFAEVAEIKQKLQKMSEQEVDIVICVIPSSESDGHGRPEYNEIKIAADLDVGILTQCIKSDTISNGTTEYRETFLLNINAKLNGINQKLSTAPILKDFDAEPVMFIGAHIAPPTTSGQQNVPSFAGMVASHDPNAFCYSIGRRSQDEAISTFRANFTENLKTFREKNDRLPKKLIYFREDESGHPFHKTIEKERMAMLEAYRDVSESHDETIKITIIIVEQEPHLRLFARLNANDDKSTNVPTGTIVDTFIAHHDQQEFYMVSQQAIEGVTRPTKYRVFIDQANHNIYDLQELIFFLCHMFARCNRSVSTPAPTRHARLVAKHSKVYLSNGSADTDNLDNNEHRPVKTDGMYHI